MWWYDPWRGISPPVATPLCAYCGCPACRKASAEVELMKRPVFTAEEGLPALARVEVPKSLTKMPNVAELLIQPAWEDATGKGERMVFSFVSLTSVRLLVKIENPPLKVSVVGRGWDEAWAALEVLLRGDDIPWETDAPRPQKGGRKK